MNAVKMVELHIRGMDCAECARHIQGAQSMPDFFVLGNSLRLMRGKE